MSEDKPLILIGERDPFVREILERELSAEFDLVFVEDGSSVLEKARELSPAVVVLEVLLPETDGLQVCRRLKENPSTLHIPVLVFSLLLAEERAFQAGADGFLLKPFCRKRFVETLYRLIRNR